MVHPAPNYPDPERELIASPERPVSAKVNLRPAQPFEVGPVWVLVSMLAQVIEKDTGLPPDRRVALYQSACDNLLTHNHEGTGSEAEIHVHYALSHFADILGVQNA